MLTIRPRGKIFHCRGTVRVGEKVRIVAEHTTGFGKRPLAEAYKVRLEKEIQDELLYGRAGRAARVTFAEVGKLYITRPEGLNRTDIWRIMELNKVLGSHSISDIKDGWRQFVDIRCPGLSPGTVNRFRDTLQASLNHGAEPLDYDAPRIARIRFFNERLRWLTIDHADRLVASYADHVQPIIRMYRYNGPRAQEALQLQWPNVDLARGTAYFERTKSSLPRTVKLHEKVLRDLRGMWEKRDKPDLGHVFLNRLGKPYADTRDYKLPGGNPLRQAHSTALRRARIRPNGGEDFTLHDWRHHWASWCVMSGVDLVTIRNMGGWKDLRMVERYSAVSTDHMEAAMRRIR